MLVRLWLKMSNTNCLKHSPQRLRHVETTQGDIDCPLPRQKLKMVKCRLLSAFIHHLAFTAEPWWE
jgi:hypothetical protein